MRSSFNFILKGLLFLICFYVSREWVMEVTVCNRRFPAIIKIKLKYMLMVVLASSFIISMYLVSYTHTYPFSYI